jgi:hypothetical protein
MTTESDLRPLQPIRRFDVFAETKRLEALAHGEPDDVAKGYGIRIAKIVASRRFGGTPKKDHAKKKSASERESSTGDRFRGDGDARFRALDGELQTDETFDHDIIDRMGPEFYEVVFQPAIREALAEGRKYEQFRDTIRKDWKPNRG